MEGAIVQFQTLFPSGLKWESHPEENLFFVSVMHLRRLAPFVKWSGNRPFSLPAEMGTDPSQ